MHTTDDQYLTVAEAAKLLRVAPSTVRRWIRDGDVPAYRIGQRRLALMRTDLTNLITPVGSGCGQDDGIGMPERFELPRLTIEEQQRSLDALERAEQLNKEILERRGGKPLRSSLDVIHETREERTRQLG
jgi:excisionase family DNA binding protein